MDAARNPYAPGAGRRPAALVGRDEQIEQWRVALARTAAGRGAQSVVLYGLRGVGKTVLLNTFVTMVENESWIVAKVEAGTTPLREALIAALHAPLSDLARPSAGARLKSALKTMLSFRALVDSTGTWSFGLDLSEERGGGADTGVFETDLAKLVKDLAAAVADERVGLAILIDEAQDLEPDELKAVSSVVHLASQQTWPVLFGLAGLPSLPRILAEARSYAERLYSYQRIEQLEPAAAAQALTAPAAAEQVSWDRAAVGLLVETTRGYPYFLQQYGQETWNEATGPAITITDARVGAARGTTTLDNGFFRVRWDRATRAEQQYLRAMAEDGDTGSASGVVATRLNRPVSSFGPVRASLISKGLIFAPEHGRVQFTVPGMADFIHRQPDPEI